MPFGGIGGRGAVTVSRSEIDQFLVNGENVSISATKNVSADGTLIIEFTTSTTRVTAIIDAVVSTEGNATVEFFEGQTSSGGSAMLEKDMNRILANTPELAAVQDSVVTVDGTELLVSFIGGGGKSKATGGVLTGDRGWILALNTKYFVRVTDLTTASQNVSINLTFIEDA